MKVNMNKFSLFQSSIIILALCGGLCPPSSKASAHTSDSELSANFMPNHYDIHLQVILHNSTFNSETREYKVPGKVRIIGRAIIPENASELMEITLQVENLNVNHSSVSVAKLPRSENHTSTLIPIKSIELIKRESSPYVPPLYLIIIQLDLGGGNGFSKDLGLIQNGDELEVSMEYSTTVIEASSKPGNNGFVYSSYTTDHSEIRKFVRAENIPTGFSILKILPSIQTIEYESSHTFQLTIVHEKKYTCISNTPLEITSEDPENDDWVHDRFSKSIQMPISMLSFVISDFSFVEAHFGNHKSVRVHAPEHILERGNYTVHVAAKILSFLDDYLGDYFAAELPKVDIVWNGENNEQKGKLTWGLYVDTEKKLFPSPGDTESPPKQFLPELLSYPLAYQYLGVKRIDPTFISFLEWKAIQNASFEGLISEERLDEIISCDRSEALFSVTEDSNPFFRKFEAHCSTHIERWLDPNTVGVPYLSSMDVLLLTMLEQTFTPEVFKQAFLSHLKKFDSNRSRQFWDIWGQKKILCKFLNTSFINLFHSSNILNVSTFDHILDINWYYRSFPVMQVWKVSNEDIGMRGGQISKNSTKVQKTGDDEPKLIPVEIEEHIDWPNTGCNFTRKLIVPMNKTEFLVGDNNIGYSGIMYDPVLLDDILENLEKSDFGGITPLKRAQLLDDHFLFVFITKGNNGVINDTDKEYRIQALLNLTRYLDKETSVAVWNIVLVNLKYFEIALSIHPEYPKLQVYFRQKLESALKTFGFETVENSESFDNYSEIFIVSNDNPWSLVNLRGNLLFWACKMGSKICMKIGHQFLDMWRNSPEEENRDEQFLTILTRYPLVSAVVLGVGSEDAVSFCVDKIKHPPASLKDVKSWRMDLLRAVALCKDENILIMTLNSSLEMPDDVYRYMLSFTAVNPQGNQAVLNFFKNSIMGRNEKYLHAMIEVLPKIAVLSEEEIVEVEGMLKENKSGMKEYLYDELSWKLNQWRRLQEKDLAWVHENGKHIFSWVTAELNLDQDEAENINN